MKIAEFLTELTDRPAQYELVYSDDALWEINCPTLGITLNLIRQPDYNTGINVVIIEFSVNGQSNITGGGNAFSVLSTVSSMIKTYLPRFIKPSDYLVQFGAEKSEPSRIKLYRRAIPIISSILGSNWYIDTPGYSGGSLELFTWARKKIKLKEKKVESAWIVDLRLSRPKKILTMTLSNGAVYNISNITRTTFERWIKSESKGRFFHTSIRNRYDVKKVR